MPDKQTTISIEHLRKLHDIEESFAEVVDLLNEYGLEEFHPEHPVSDTQKVVMFLKNVLQT